MTFDELIKEFKRMCWHYTRDKEQKKCPMCKSDLVCNISHCRMIAFEHPDRFASTIARWAKEHPEPVYPTWRELINAIGGYIRPDGTIQFGILAADKPISKEIAEKLGIEPKVM